MPLKPVKHGIKLWMRLDAKTGYIHDFNIYQGKSDNTTSKESTLKERLVRRLEKTVQCAPADVSFATDRFFTSVKLTDSTSFLIIDTYVTTRKNIRIFPRKKMERGDCCFQTNNKRIMAN